MSEEVFFRLHSGLPREGPGSDADTRRALAMAGVAGAVRVLDMGAGPGAASLVLLEALARARVTAVELHAPFLAEAGARVAASGHAARFSTLIGDMGALDVPDASADLIWCESAIYNLGVTEALRAWRRLLAPGGTVVFSEAVWLTDAPAPAARAFWAAEYPPMTDMDGVRAQVAAAGYRVVGDFLLGEAAWEAYYGPLATREEALRAGIGDDPALAETRAEIALRAAHGSDYGYAMFVVRPEAA